MTKLGLHANRSSAHLVPFVRDARPRIVKFLDHDYGTVKACHDASPDTLLIGRLFTGDQRYQQPRANARAYVDKILPVAERLRGLYEAWESYNELEPQNPDEAKLFSEFHVHFAEFMHREGLKTIAYNFSTGVPKLEMWRYYQDGAAASDYIGLHEYDAPTMDRLQKENLAIGGEGAYLALRYRRVWGLLGPAARKPIIITECGIDGGVINDTYRDDDGNRVKKLGYKDFARFNQVSVNDYMSNLTWYDDEMLKDDYLVGACIFCFGADSGRWYSFDLGDDEDPAPQARDALRRTIRRPLPPLRPVSVTGQFVPPPREGQPPTDGWWSPRPAPQPAPPPPPPPQPAPQPAPPPQPAPQPAPQPSPAPCPTPPADWFAARFNADGALRAALGCPTGSPTGTFLAEQHYQNGFMIYRADNKSIVVLLQWGTWSAYPDRWNTEQPEAGYVNPPPGLIEPKRGFGKVWREQLGGANAAIGFATDGEEGQQGAVQNFDHGAVIRNAKGELRILLVNGKWMA